MKKVVIGLVVAILSIALLVTLPFMFKSNQEDYIDFSKVSENVDKITTPGVKNLYRIYDKKTKKAEADLITLFDEKIDENKPISIFHPIYTWKTTTYEDYILRPMLKQIFKNGELIYKLPDIKEIREYCASEIESLWDEFKRFDNPHIYKVDLSKDLWELKNNLLKETIRISKKAKKQSE